MPCSNVGVTSFLAMGACVGARCDFVEVQMRLDDVEVDVTGD